MSTNPFRLCTAAVAATAALALALTGCSSSSKSPSPAAASPTPATSAPSANPGASALSVDGKPVSGNFTTTCAHQGGLLALALTDTGNAAYGNLAVSATVTGGNTVQAVGITGSKGGSSGLPYAIGFGKGAPGGSASLVKSGNTFHVTGEGVGTPDPGNPLAEAKSSKFDITFACPTVIGG
ncbi:lipoprotein LpqH [Nocardia vaccinii]|uniref:lipoprotein LpqH n=1 Tax=Nocardia vaccinii TaxID=1822 RepID=UPI000836C910|nr:lipoprotein LpqH [Nocardia vaccinii]